MPKFLGEIIQSGGDFALLDSSNIRGGFQHVSTIQEMESIIPDKRKEGMLVYVEQRERIYQWHHNKWIIFSAGGGSIPDANLNHEVYYTISQSVEDVREVIGEDGSVSFYGLKVDGPIQFKGGDILGWDITTTDEGDINGSYLEVAYVDDGIMYVQNKENLIMPEKYETLYLAGSTSDINRRLILAIHPYKGGVVLSQFLNMTIENINTNYTFRLGQHDVNYWKVYGEDVYFKGTFIDNQGRNLSDLVTLNQETITTGLESLRRDLGYDNMLNNPYFIGGMDCWLTENSANYFTFGGKFIMTNKTLFTDKREGAYVVIEDSQALLRLINGFILQKNENLRKILDLDNISKPYYVTLIFSYKAVSAGDLKVSMIDETLEGYDDGEVLPAYKTEQHLEGSADNNYHTFRSSFLWNGSGDFRLEYLGGEIKIQTLVIRINEVKTFERKYKELFEYSDTLIQMAKEYSQQTT